jgi:hypothetical protein
MSLRFVLVGLLLAGLFAWSAHGDDVERFTPTWKRWYETVKPAEREQKWKRIPWMLDLDEALTQAKKEKRPLLLWTSGDEPLDRC